MNKTEETTKEGAHGEPTSVISSKQGYLTRFGREIKISPKSLTNVTTEPGNSIKINTESVSVSIGIGKDHVAWLIMEKSAWNALLAGEEIHIETTEGFKKKFGEAGNGKIYPLIK